MRNRIISTALVIIISAFTLSSSLYFVMAEDNVITNASENNNVNTLSLNEQKEQVEQELEKAEEQLTYVQGELSDAVIQIQKLDDRIQEYQKQFLKWQITLKKMKHMRKI